MSQPKGAERRLAQIGVWGTFRVTLTVGRLVRRDVVRRIRDYCFVHGLTLTIDEDRGWLDTTLYITVRGQGGQVAPLLHWISELSEEEAKP